MSLLEEKMEPCVMLNKTTTPDGYGSSETVWEEGKEIQAAFAADSSTPSRIAESQGVKNKYSIFTRKDVTLQFHDVLRRVRDGKVFRVTSDGYDKKTPESAALDARKVTAEEWELVT